VTLRISSPVSQYNVWIDHEDRSSKFIRKNLSTPKTRVAVSSQNLSVPANSARYHSQNFHIESMSLEELTDITADKWDVKEGLSIDYLYTWFDSWFVLISWLWSQDTHSRKTLKTFWLMPTLHKNIVTGKTVVSKTKALWETGGQRYLLTLS
jgi:hypothetical protein